MSKRRVFLLLLLLIFIELLNSQTWYELYIEGRKMILNGQFQTGIQKLLLATKVKPNSQLNARIYGMNFIDYIPYFYIGYAYFHLKNYSNAKDYLEKELELGVIRGLAKEYSQLNDLLNKVREYLSKSDKREGKIENTASSEARNEAVGISEYEKRFKDAMKLKAELKYTECIEALDSLAKDVLRIEHSKRNELLAEIYFQIGMCYFFQNNEELVIESFKKIFNYSPDYDIDREVYSERVVKLFDRAKEVYRGESISEVILAIYSEPSGATIYIQGIKRGETPLIFRLMPGKYEIKVQKPGYKEEVDTIMVRADQAGQPISKRYNLKPLGKGILVVSAVPKALVEVDGKRISELTPEEDDIDEVPPAKSISVFEGSHEIKFILRVDEGKDLIETKQITIKAGETVTVHHKFQNLPESAINIEKKKNIAWITILAYPYAIIEIDGKTYGEVPPALSDIELSPGTHLIKFVLPKLKKTYQMRVTLKEGEKRKIFYKFD